ncbi:hypothetical protein EYF80_044336 [Liparis tanakae]|uniref:Uncharacterized protein n=1 Tax=Liparis tanakae TaxID=230148 RepID=A0A4Z2FW70_9TELE|nr:hypothetical protein EYF80_044336 [Liparis tanakae]
MKTFSPSSWRTFPEPHESLLLLVRLGGTEPRVMAGWLKEVLQADVWMHACAFDADGVRMSTPRQDFPLEDSGTQCEAEQGAPPWDKYRSPSAASPTAFFQSTPPDLKQTCGAVCGRRGRHVERHLQDLTTILESCSTRGVRPMKYMMVSGSRSWGTQQGEAEASGFSLLYRGRI